MTVKPRKYVVTGSASGIGKATSERLQAQGSQVIGVDLHDADIVADLGTADGRKVLVAQVADLSDGVVDGVVASAGVVVASDLAIRVNYFGAVATLEGLRPLLAKSDAPAAAVIASIGAMLVFDAEVTNECLEGTEESATAAARAAVERGADRGVIYSSTKRAIARWMRRRAISDDWAGAGIPLNAIGPGVIATPMMEAALGDPEQRARLEASYSMPLGGLGASPDHPAALLAWLVGPENRLVTGQLVFIDGGYETVVRGDDIFPALQGEHAG